MAGLVVQFLLLATAVVVAGVFLSWSADEIAARTGLGRLLIGSVLLAGATSMPELSVDIAAIRSGNSDLAVGDLLGSSLMNLLILAVLDLMHSSRGQMFSRPAAAHALSGAAGIALTSVVAIAIATERHSNWGEWCGLGGGAWFVLIGYLLSARIIFIDQRIGQAIANRQEPRSRTPEEPAPNPRDKSWHKPALIFALAATATLAAGPYLSATAVEFADRAGLAKTFIGTTLVALCTSLPELVSCWAAVRIKAVDLAVGNILGSNAFNMVLIVVLDVIHPGSLLATVSVAHVVTANTAILATSVTVMGQLFLAERRRWFIEPDALMVMAIVLAGLALVFATSA